MNDIKLALMTGIDIPIPEIQLTLHQPSIKEISFIGDLNFFTGLQCLVIDNHFFTSTQDETLLTNLSNFQIFMMIMAEKEAQDKKEAVLQIFQLLFPSYKVYFFPQSIVFSKDQEEENHIVDENNFEILQEIIKMVFCHNSAPMDMQTFNPADAKAKEIADKLMKARERVAAQKKDGDGSMFAQYVSTLTVGLNSMSLQDCINLTMYQLLDLMERYSLYINWDLDMKARLAGAKQENKPENWMKNIH